MMPDRFFDTFGEDVLDLSLTSEDIHDLRRRAWLEHGLLILSAFDERLSDVEARWVCRTAERYYGEEE